MARDIKVRLITAPNCDGNVKLVAIYQPSKKVFINMSRYDKKYEIPLGEAFEYQLEQGTMTVEFQALVGQVPEFKKLYNQIKDQLVEKHKEGDQVVKFDSYNGKPEIWTCGKVENFKKTCSLKSKKSSFICERKIVHSKTGKVETAIEEVLHPIKTLDKFNESKKAVLAFRRALKADKLLGGQLVYKGNVYAF